MICKNGKELPAETQGTLCRVIHFAVGAVNTAVFPILWKAM